ncbi:CheR family methyltransferase [Pseudalkalibacillus berkeleyi]|uniref:protein-glutamate O-methyltransferase n=1 Tax=Pseudalkalibacillus berkeleyi TaxID=1069813 RepID=A0ABS9H1R5_9BACL|nr:protein-glutamate O-methyltransferase CheR [Pseudalkalibacillus berkeleyi]MCF6137575.1 protein-glutamate O-methyltransferase CheR [Pseudalkalibacillus berkeleyi]
MDQDYIVFSNHIKKHTGIDLTLYKEAQMKRRLIALREKKGFETFSVFYEAMKQNNTLLEEFLDRMTINVSEFYRNPSRWEVLEKEIIPELIKDRKKLKVWSAACSTGEEPYTLSMILKKVVTSIDHSILATDLDELAIKRAKLGYYLERSLKDVPDDLKEKYFKKEGIGFKVDDVLKEKITFEKHNMLAAPFKKDFDLIVCRNVMIYFTEDAKAQLYQKFSDALRPGGILFVGSTEQIFNPKQYGLESAATFFYVKK